MKNSNMGGGEKGNVETRALGRPNKVPTLQGHTR